MVKARAGRADDAERDQRRHPTASRPVRAVVGIFVGALLLAGCLSADAQSFVDRTNQLRSSKGVPALANHRVLDAKAQAWAEVLASRRTVSHSNLADGLSGIAWRSIAENLASGSASGDWTSSLHGVLVRSPAHRANLVDRDLTHMGVGVAHAGGKVYVVEVFAEIR